MLRTAHDSRAQADRWIAIATGLLALGLLAWLTRVVVSREGNLAWDDADYLRRGLHWAGLAAAKGPLAWPSAVANLLRERPKPPFLVGWIEMAVLVLGRRDPMALVVSASVVPYALLALAVVAVARNLADGRAALAALAGLACSPMSLSFGAKVMVETFMALWVLLTLYAAARLLERPSRGRAALLGVALAGAVMTKLTAALILPVPALYFAIAYARRHPLDRTVPGLLVALALPLLLLAGPWYLKNGRAALEFAFFSARYDVVAVGRADGTTSGQRLVDLVRVLVGWPSLGIVAVALAGLWPRRRGATAPRPVAVDFAVLATIGAVSGAVILLLPSYFDPRFLLPVWPALAVCLGMGLGAFAQSGLRAGLAAAMLGLGLWTSAARLALEPRNATYWDTRLLIDELVADHHARNIGNVGNCGHWNVCKTGLANELRSDPGACFVLHDLSRDAPELLARRLERFDAVLVLDHLPPGWLAAAPGLNRSHAQVERWLRSDPRFAKVEPRLAADLPALSVYVRRR